MLGGLQEPEKGISDLLLPLQRVQCLMELCLSLSFATELLLELSEAGVWSRFCKGSSSCTRLCQTLASLCKYCCELSHCLALPLTPNATCEALR